MIELIHKRYYRIKCKMNRNHHYVYQKYVAVWSVKRETVIDGNHAYVEPLGWKTDRLNDYDGVYGKCWEEVLHIARCELNRQGYWTPKEYYREVKETELPEEMR